MKRFLGHSGWWSRADVSGLCRGAIRRKAARDEHPALVGQKLGVMLVMTHENDGRPTITGECAYHSGYLRTKWPVERREWFVEKQHPWGRQKSPTQRHPLAFPSGEKPGAPVE